MRATKADIEQRVLMLSKVYTQKFNLDWLSGKPRLDLNGRFLSPRLTTTEMSKWIDAFEAGLDLGMRDKEKVYCVTCSSKAT
jgi:hypothetical protein